MEVSDSAPRNLTALSAVPLTLHSPHKGAANACGAATIAHPGGFSADSGPFQSYFEKRQFFK